jgi:hypothetical protein
MTARRYIVDPHVHKRLQDRKMTFRSIRYAIRNATTCVAYAPDREPLAGGTSWRVTGPDFAGDETSVGVETFEDHLGRRVILVTVF